MTRRRSVRCWVAAVAVTVGLNGCAVYNPFQVNRHWVDYNSERCLSFQGELYEHLPLVPVRVRLITWGYNVGDGTPMVPFYGPMDGAGGEGPDPGQLAVPPSTLTPAAPPAVAPPDDGANVPPPSPVPPATEFEPRGGDLLDRSRPPAYLPPGSSSDAQPSRMPADRSAVPSGPTAARQPMLRTVGHATSEHPSFGYTGRTGSAASSAAGTGSSAWLFTPSR